jgi:hypothetical protein
MVVEILIRSAHCWKEIEFLLMRILLDLEQGATVFHVVLNNHTSGFKDRLLLRNAMPEAVVKGIE